MKTTEIEFWRLKIGIAFTMQGELFTKLNRKEATRASNNEVRAVAEETQVSIPRDYNVF